MHAALLAPEPLPLFLFAEARAKFGPPLASALEGDGLDEAVAALRAFALVDREPIADERDPTLTTDCIKLHRLVRQVAQGRREDEAREAARRALVEALAAVYSEDVYNDPAAWQRARRLDAIALALVGDAAALPQGVDEHASSILDGLASYRNGALAAYAAARPLSECALAIREKVLGPEHRDTATSLNNFADLPRDQGEFAAARPLYERALAIREKVLGREHPDTAYSLNTLACLIRDMGDAEAAEPLFRRAISVKEKVRGLHHPDVARGCSNLACLLRDAERADEAEPLFLRAIAIGDKALGAEHPLTQRYQSHYARLLLTTGRALEALQRGQAALATHERVNRSNHPWTKGSAHVTADALDALDRGAEAAVLREKYGIVLAEKTDYTS